MAIPVPALAGNAIPKRTSGNFLSLTRHAGRSAGDDLEPVITLVTNCVMRERVVAFASLFVRSAVNIPSVPYVAMRLVLHVSKCVHGLASTKGLALCPVLPPVIDCHAINAVPKNFPAVTSVQDFVVRYAPKGTATNVR